MAEFQEVAKNFERMCSSNCCEKCPMSIEFGIRTKDARDCRDWAIQNPSETEKVIEDWAKEHPAETWKSKLKKVLPNSEIDYLNNCPRDLFGGDAPGAADKECDGKCVDCWNREVIP